MAAEKMTSDCKVVQGKVPGPTTHMLCTKHGHVVDIKTHTVLAKNLEEYKKNFKFDSATAFKKITAASTTKMAADCKPAPGKMPGLPTNIQLCATHHHVLDVTAKKIIAKNQDEFMNLWQQHLK